MSIQYVSNMKIILLFVGLIIFSITGVAAFADNDTLYYDQVTNPPLAIVSDQQSLISVSLKQGESIQLPIFIKMDQDYSMESITQIALGDKPDGVKGWIDPNMLSDTIDKTHIANGTLYLYVDSTTKPGNYTIKIIGSGAIKEISTGKDIQIMNPSEVNKPEQQIPPGIESFQEFWKRQAAESGLLGTIQVQIIPNPVSITLHVGDLDQSYKEFCSKDNDHGTSCSGFITNQQIPLNITSDSKTQVRLEMSLLPNGGWIAIYPKTLQSSPSGSLARLMMAGAEWPPGINPSDTHAITIQAISQNGDTSTAFIPITVVQNMTVLHSGGPIQFQNEVPMNSNQKQNAVYGAVYDPLDDSKQIQVNLKVLGMINDTRVVPLPSWLSVEIPNSTLTLNARDPYYFMINPITSSAPEGTFTVTIGENVEGQDYVENLRLHIFNVRFGGVTGGSLHLGPPASPSTISYGTEANSWLSIVVFGGIVGSVTSVVSVYVMRKK